MPLDFVAFAESGQGQAAIEAAGAVSLSIDVQDPGVRAATLADIVRQEATAQLPAEVRAYREMAITSQRVSTTFRFRGGSDELDARGLEDARRLAGYLRGLADQSELKVTLVGFADSRGLAPANLELANRRAESVARQLAAEGFAGARAMAVGEDVSVACNTTDAGRLVNRRGRSLVRVTGSSPRILNWASRESGHLNFGLALSVEPFCGQGCISSLLRRNSGADLRFRGNF